MKFSLICAIGKITQEFKSPIFIGYSQYSAPRAHFCIKVCVTAQKMREGPSEPACRSRLQTT